MNRLFFKCFNIIIFFVYSSSFANDDINDLLNISDNNEQFYVIGETEKLNIEINDLLPNKSKKINTLKTKKQTSKKEIKITKIDGSLELPPKPENLIILNDEFNLSNKDEIKKLKDVVLANSLNKKETITLEDLKNEREKLEQMKLKLIDMQKANLFQRDVSSSKVLSGKDFKKF